MERINQLTDFLTKESSLLVDITASILTHRKRTFTEDSKRLAKKFENPIVLGTENIPTCPKPVIIACNHPNRYDLAVGGVNITRAFAKKREAYGLPGNIRWMIAQNFVFRDNSNIVDQRIIYPIINRVLKRVHQTYDFISVPLNYLNLKNQRKERAATLLSARKYLTESPYSTIGIFPEGDFRLNDQLLDFYGGIGVLCRSTRTEVVVLPTAIYRGSKDALTVSFGQALQIDPAYSGKEITQNIKTAIELVKNSI